MAERHGQGAHGRPSTRVRRVLSLGGVIGVAVAIGLASTARAADPDLQAGGERLREALGFFDRLDDLDAFGDALPLTDATEDALGLFSDPGGPPDPVQALQDELASRLGSVADPAALADALDLDGSYGGVEFAVSGPGGADVPLVVAQAEPSTIVDIVIQVTATRTVDLPLAAATDLGDLLGESTGTFPVDVSLTTNAWHFELDTDKATDPDLAGEALGLRIAPDLAVAGSEDAPELRLQIAATDSELASFETSLGFAAVSVTGSIGFDLEALVVLTDPDGPTGDEIITSADFVSIATEDLVDLSFPDDPDTNAAEATIMVDTALLDGTPDLTLGYEAATLADVADATLDFDVDDTLLDDFGNFTPTDALAALERIVTLLSSLQSTGRLDPSIPFITPPPPLPGATDQGTGTFSDALDLGDVLAAAVADPSLLVPDDPATELNEAVPAFVDAQGFAEAIEDALGLAAGTITPEYLPSTGPTVPPRLTFELEFAGTGSATEALSLGNLDILQAIQVDAGGSVDLDATYSATLPFALDLTRQPTEDGAGVGSCTDGLDNGPDDDDPGTVDTDGPGVDASDPECVGTQTLERRVQLQVGEPGDASPEVVAGVDVAATGVTATGRIGLLEAGITTGSTTAAAEVAVDLGAPGGWLTIADAVNAFGVAPPAGATFDVSLDATIDGSFDVAAGLVAPGDLGGGTIEVSGAYAGPITGASDLLDSVTVDASDLRTGELLNFSPCGNAADEDGDGAVNDGCAAVGAPETVDQCADALDDDGDGAINDGCAENDDSEASSAAMLDQILALVRGIGDRLQDSGALPPAFEQPLPLVGASVADVLDFGDTLVDFVDGVSQGSEQALADAGIVADACTNATDDDFDGLVNDGCPRGPGAENLPEAGAQCIDAVDDPAPTDGDDVVNDGCPAATPTLQNLGPQLSGYLNQLLGSLGLTPDVAAAFTYDAAGNDLLLSLDVGVEATAETAFSFDLGDTLGDLVSLEAIGDTELVIDADLSLDLGLDLTTFDPFLLGSSGLTAGVTATGVDLSFGAGYGGLELTVGQPGAPGDPALAEDPADCADTVDSDGDGYVNDGCPQVPAPETGDQCVDHPDDGPLDDDEDGVIDDGCPGGPPAAGPAAPETDCAIGETEPADDDEDGFVNDGCISQPDRGRFAIGAALTLDTGDDTTQYPFEDVELTGDFGGTAQAPCEDVDGGTPATAAGEAKDGCAVLPLYLDGDPIKDPAGDADDHHVVIAMPDLFDPDTWEIAYDTTQLEAFLAQQLIDLALSLSGLDALFDVLRDLLQSDLLSFSFPIIGGDLSGALALVDTLEAEVKTRLAEALTTQNLDGLVAPTAADVDGVLQGLADTVGDALVDAGLIADRDDFTAAISCAGLACDVDDGGDGDGMDPGSAVDDIRFGVQLSDDIILFDLEGEPNEPTFDLGIPGLSFTATNAQVQGNLSWAVRFGFGISKADGFYFVTENVDVDGDTVPDPELTINGTIRISDADPNADPAQLTARLGFLSVVAVDGDPAAVCNDTGTSGGDPCRLPEDGDPEDRSTFTLGFAVDLQDPNDDGRLTFAELGRAPNFSQIVEFDLTATAEVHLHLETSIAEAAALPKLFADLDLTWSWDILGSDDEDDLEPGSGSALDIGLNNVALDAGTFLSEFLGPIFEDVKRFTDPFKPVLDTVNAPIPVLSDLAGEPITLLTLAETFGGGDQSFAFIIDLVRLISFVTDIASFSGSGNLAIPIGDGSFDLSADTLQNGPLAANAAQSAFAPGELSGLTSLLGGLDTAVGSEGGDDLTVSGLDEIGVSFPFLENPAKLLGLLFGQDVDLIVWEPEELTFGFSYSQKFGPIWAVPPVFLEIGGSASVTGRFGIGYDTEGFRLALIDGEGPAALLKGLFLVDRHPLAGGPDSNELELRGELFANAQVSVLVFSAGAQGSVFLTIGIDLEDPNSDGRVKYQEVADRIRSTGNVLCIFNLNGQFGIRISVFAEIDLFFWSQRWTKTLAEIILYEFKVDCAPLADPILATDLGDGTLRINVGPNAKFRDADGTGPDNSVGFDVIDEQFVITRVAGGVNVTGLGFTQFYGGDFTSVLADASNPPTGDQADEDVITFADGTACPPGDDNPTDGCSTGVPVLTFFDIPGIITGGPGNDELTGGRASDVMSGGDGNDNLTAREGNNNVQGGAGDDAITTGGNMEAVFGSIDTIDGGDGNDRIDASLGGDMITGGDGDDDIDGGRSIRIDGVEFADGGDIIDAGPGNDTVDGGAGDDTIITGPGRDFANGEVGNDTITDGGTEDGRCFNGTDEDDVLVGGPGVDTIDAGAGDDKLAGGSLLAGQPDANGDDGVGDTLNGGDGCDQLVGDNATQDGAGNLVPTDPANGGNDVMTGGNGADTISGWIGDDTMRGDDAAAADEAGTGCIFDGGFLDASVDNCDTLVGADGDDVIDGDGATDTIDGDAGNDTLVGGDGDDLIRGGTGLDVILGDLGTVAGGVPTFNGGTGADQLFGGPDRDRMFGQGGGDVIFGDGGDDEIHGGESGDLHNDLDGNDTIRGGVGDDLLLGNNGSDEIHGEAGADRMVGGSATAGNADAGTRDLAPYGTFGDFLFGGNAADVLAGDNAVIAADGTTQLLDESTIGEADLLYGENGDDDLYGENGADLLKGGTGDDHGEGGADSDTVLGQQGQDDLIGGTTERADGAAADADSNEQPDAGDIVDGGPGADVIAGDNASITRPGGTDPDGAATRVVTLFDLDDGGGDSPFSGEDNLIGGAGPDDLYGGGEADEIAGGTEDDHLEGNGGSDHVVGGANQDDLIGGTSADVDADGIGGDEPDAGDDLVGGDGAGGVGDDDHDVVTGDNASISRFDNGEDGAARDWARDDLDPERGVEDVARRRIVLHDIATLDDPTAGDGTSGPEQIDGEAGHDQLYGQGDDDALFGGAGDDFGFGNDGADLLEGGDGQDDLVGGTGRTDSFLVGSGADGRLDDADRLYGATEAAPDDGDDDFDVLMGDNAVVLRGAPLSPPPPDPVPGSAWDVNAFNGAVRRAVFLYDVGVVGAPVDAATNGPDLMLGGADDDVMYGQGDGDTEIGAAGDDYIEGNEGADDIQGGLDDDDLIGGTGRINLDPEEGVDGRLDAGEVQIVGGPGFDWLAGDNAVVARLVDDDGEWIQNTYNGGVAHARIWLRDVDTVGALAGPGTSGGEVLIDGNGDDDVAYGQGGDEIDIRGSEGDDYLEGNAGDDVITGGANQDDIVGGTGCINADPAARGDGPADQGCLSRGDANPGTDGRLDGDDVISGDTGAGLGGLGEDDFDVIAGDNAILERPLTGAGDWAPNIFNDGVVRALVRMDLEVDGEDPVDADVHGDDVAYGNGDDDVMRGQGGDDELHGGAGQDDIEGNHARDVIFGDLGEDDLLGGSRVVGHLDDGDLVFGGAGHDVALGDNGALDRPVGGTGEWQHLQYGYLTSVIGASQQGDNLVRVIAGGNTTAQDRIVREVGMLDATPGATSGSDMITGEGGDDELYGQFDDTGDPDGTPVPVLCDGESPIEVDDPNTLAVEPVAVTVAGDLVCGGPGEDGILGDQGVIVDEVASGAAPNPLRHNGAPFIREEYDLPGTLSRVTTLTQFTLGGEDVLLGGDDHDSIHAGADDDVANGDGGDDYLMLADGADAAWGGPGNDISFGGYGGDHLDLKPRTAAQFPSDGDPLSWFLFAPDDPSTVDPDGSPTPAAEGYDQYQGYDIHYGGWDQDAMQANIGGNGPVPGDRLIDWAGAYNAYYVCPASYGEMVATRQQSPSMIVFLEDLAAVLGATTVEQPTRDTSSGYNEAAIVYRPDIRHNTNPIHPDTPAHFTCE